MWKIIVGFIIFAALALFVIIQGGDQLDMSGEKQGGDATHASDKPASATSAPASTAPAPAQAAGAAK